MASASPCSGSPSISPSDPRRSPGAPRPGRDAVPDGVHADADYCVASARITDDWVIDLFEACARGASDQAPGRAARRRRVRPRRTRRRTATSTCCWSTTASRGRCPAEIEPIASALWYPLWDAGVKLGHAVRRVDEQLDLVDGDLDSATALLSARFLAGDEEHRRRGHRAGSALVGVAADVYLTALRDQDDRRGRPSPPTSPTGSSPT